MAAIEEQALADALKNGRSQRKPHGSGCVTALHQYVSILSMYQYSVCSESPRVCVGGVNGAAGLSHPSPAYSPRSYVLIAEIVCINSRDRMYS